MSYVEYIHVFVTNHIFQSDRTVFIFLMCLNWNKKYILLINYKIICAIKKYNGDPKRFKYNEYYTYFLCNTIMDYKFNYNNNTAVIANNCCINNIYTNTNNRWVKLWFLFYFWASKSFLIASWKLLLFSFTFFGCNFNV